MRAFLSNQIAPGAAGIFLIFSIITISSISIGVVNDDPLILILPIGLLVVFAGLLEQRFVFYMLLAGLPLSIEYYLPNGLATDLPSEPLMWLLTGFFLFYAFRHSRELNGKFLTHPISIMLWLHLFWMGLMVLFAEHTLIGLKFWIAKSWYISACYLLGPRLMRSERDFARSTAWLLIPLTAVILFILTKHAAYGFSFSTVNKAMSPFFRNHVNYASIVVLCLPYLWWHWVKKPVLSFWWLAFLGTMVLYLIAIQFSYTRAAYVSVAGAFGLWFLIKRNWLRKLMPIGVLLAGFFIYDYLKGNEYLNHNPNYKTTVTHYRFENLIEATAKGEDISTMERVYRWLAGIEMIRKRPLTGFGPGNFYDSYRSYTINSFETYVSDNKEGSGIHCYYLMTTVDQGLIGGAIFIILVLVSLVYAEKIYWQTDDPTKKRRLMAVVMSQGIIYLILMINDMLETDKVGPFFFLNMALIVHFDLESRKVASTTLSHRDDSC
jgi:O-antigen ligase